MSFQSTWTPPGDDGVVGTAHQYDIRYSTAIITADNFAAATAMTGAPTPSVAGTPQSAIVGGLTPNTPCYFAMKTADGKSGEYKWYTGPLDPSGLFISMNFVEQGDGTFLIHWDYAGVAKWDLTVSADGRSDTYDWYMVNYAGGGGSKLFQHTVWADCHGSRTTDILDPPQVETW